MARVSARLAGLLALAVAVTACVIVPLDPKTGRPYETSAPVVVVQSPASAAAPTTAAPSVTVLTARLYPVNDQARLAGILNASTIDTGQARGSFNINYRGETLQGEATRVDRNYPSFGQILSQVQGGHGWGHAAGQRGIANAASGSYSMRCEYLFTSVNQGTGACVMNDGARYQIHFGS
jgi:hypothetical protein